MHLWPSTMIRDSFKFEYLKKVEWNIRRMNRQKQHSSANQYLMENEASGGDAKSSPSGFSVFFNDSLMILSCCCCCLCYGVPIDEDAQ